MGRAELERVSEIKTINVAGALALRKSAIEMAQQMGVSGFLTVYSRTGMEETSQAMESATPLNVKVAKDKIKTVLAFRRSSRVQRERMEEKDQLREDYGGQLGSLFGGGVAIFADEAQTEFIGAIAFSGGTQEEDEEICRRAVEVVGFFTDATAPEPRPIEDLDLLANTQSLLKQTGIHTLADLEKLSDEKLRTIAHMTSVHIDRVRAAQWRLEHKRQ